MNSRFLLSLLCSLACLPLWAQQAVQPSITNVVVPAVVASDSDFVDPLMLPIDDKGLDLNVRIHFDEARNELTFSVTSSRQLYGFAQQVVDKKVFSRCYSIFGGRDMNLRHMPYPTLVPPKASFQMTREMYHRFRKPRRKHVFNAWCTFDGLEPLSAPDLRMLPDSLVQTFKVDARTTQCVVTLRDVIAIEKEERSARKEKWFGPHYHLAADQDLLRTYRITLQRSPCFAMEGKIANASTMADSVWHDLSRLKQRFATGLVPNKDSYTVFEQTKRMVLYRFPPIAQPSGCPDLQAQYDRYNTAVDSLVAFHVNIDPKAEDAKPLVRGLEPEYLLSNARQVDYLVASYYLSSSQQDGGDILQRCQQVIMSVNEAIVQNGIYTPEQSQALEIFRRAERYYQSVLKQIREE